MVWINNYGCKSKELNVGSTVSQRWQNIQGIIELCLSMCHFVLVFFSPFKIAITSLGEDRANLSVFRTFVRFVLV